MKKLITTLLIFCAFTYSAFSGPRFSYVIEKSIQGVILDGISGEPLVGASVQIKNTTRGTTTDATGKFSITVPDNGSVLVISFTGYADQEINVNSKSSNLSIKLGKADLANLNEVVVVGYGTQKRGDLTSAVASVKQESFVKGFVRDAGQLIQGKVAGLTISTPSGSPTAGTQIQLRGIATLNSSTSPLVLIDGIPGNLNSVAPEDIESIDVLKDGSAAAIYGTRGTNGVILITTRKQRGEAPASAEYSGYISGQTIARRPEFLDAEQFREKSRQGLNFTDYGMNTDWFKTISREMPLSHTQNFSFQGGSKTSNYTVSVNNRGWEGMFLKSVNRQLTLRADVNQSLLNGKIKVNLSAINRTRNDDGGFNNYIYRQSVIRNPTDSIYDFRGAWKERNIYFYDNPLGYLMETTSRNEQQETRLSGNINANIFKGMNVKLQVANVKQSSLNGFSETKKHISTTKNGRNGNASRNTSFEIDNLLELTGDYTRNFGVHKINLLGGYSYQDQKFENFSASNWDFPTDQYSYNRLESGNALGRGEASMNSSANSSKLIGFFGRMNYNFSDRYILSASVRREGSSKFGKNYKWGTFPAVSVGWRVKNENFLKDVEFINDLKFRAGFGVTGTAPSQPYLSIVSLNYGTRFLNNGVWIQSLGPGRNPNPDLRWETKEEFNAGVDLTILKNKVSVSLDVYKRTTRDMLYNYNVPVPPYLSPVILANAGTMENKGVELLVNYNAIQNKNFSWQTSANFSTNANKLVSLSSDQFSTTATFFTAGGTGEPVQDFTHRIDLGGPIGNFYGYKSVDISDNGLWIIEGADGKPKPYAQARPEDKKVLGNGLPKYLLGFNNNFRYKNFDLAILMRGAFGFQILNFQRMFYENSQPQILGNYNVLVSAFDKVYGKTELKNSQAYVSHYIEDGDYVKVDNITLGYNINMKNKQYVKGLRLYVSGLNTLTFTGYTGIDPEVNRSGLTPGNDERDKYPTTRTFTFGGIVNF